MRCSTNPRSSKACTAGVSGCSKCPGKKHATIRTENSRTYVLLMMISLWIVCVVVVALPTGAHGHLVYLRNILESIQPSADALADAVALQLHQSASDPELNNHLNNDNNDNSGGGPYRTIVRHTTFSLPNDPAPVLVESSSPQFYYPASDDGSYVYAGALQSPVSTWSVYPRYNEGALHHPNHHHHHPVLRTKWPSPAFASKWTASSSLSLHKPAASTITTTTEKPYERAAGTQRYLDICAITTTGAYAVPGQAGGVQPFCPYGG